MGAWLAPHIARIGFRSQSEHRALVCGQASDTEKARFGARQHVAWQFDPKG
jgi:hypothetical protein